MSKVQAKKDAKKKKVNDELSTSNLFGKKQSKLSFNQSTISKNDVSYNYFYIIYIYYNIFVCI